MRKKSFVLLALTLILAMLVMCSCSWDDWRDYNDAKKLVKFIRIDSQFLFHLLTVNVDILICSLRVGMSCN